jgi:hypothetical protein
MVDQTNSIKEILKNTKDLLSQDQELAKEEKNFNDKVAKALEGNILVLNKIYENKSVDEIDKRSKKVIEIVNHQIQDVLTLDKEVLSTQEPLLLNREVEEADQDLSENRTEEETGSPSQVATDNGPFESTDSESSNGLLVSRIKKLEDQQDRMLGELNKLVDELKSLNPSEEISLKFDIFSNQFSNEMDEKIESVKADIASIDQSKDHLAKDLGDQKNAMELGFSNLEKSNEEFKDQLNNLDFKIDDFTNSLENKISGQMEAQDTRLESAQTEQNQKIESQETSVQEQINDNFSNLKSLIEEDKLLRKKEEEENKKNSPEHQANLRLNSIYKLLEMQVTQSLINNNTNSQNTNPTHSTSENVSHEQKSSINSNSNDNTYLKAIADLSQKLDPLINLNKTLLELNKSIQNIKDASNDNNPNVFDNEKLNEILQKINNLPTQENKLEELAQLLKKMKEGKESGDSNSLENEKLIKHFKSYEFKSLEKLGVDLKEIKQFDDLHLAKKFIEKLILSETQGWIVNNQTEIEEISKKLLYK